MYELDERYEGQMLNEYFQQTNEDIVVNKTEETIESKTETTNHDLKEEVKQRILENREKYREQQLKKQKSNQIALLRKLKYNNREG